MKTLTQISLSLLTFSALTAPVVFGQVVRPQSPSVNFGKVNVCPAGQTTPTPCSETTTVTFNIVILGGTLGAPKVVTGGAPNLDFTMASTTCEGSVSAPSTCTVNVTFTPKLAGGRNGAVQIVSETGTLLATTFIYGIGVGPQVAFGPGAQIPVGTGSTLPFYVAVDAAGDLFIAGQGSEQVVEIPAGGCPAAGCPMIGSGLKNPQGVAVDGAGDILIADSGNKCVVKVPAAGGPQTTVGSGLSDPLGVAVDGAGDVFVADNINNRVVEIPAGGGLQTTVGSGLNDPIGVATDAAGDVFIADAGNNRVVEVPAGGGPQITIQASGLDHPSGVAVDAAGDVFITDAIEDSVVEVPAGGGPQITILGSGIHFPIGVAVDGAGDLFIADTNDLRVLELQRSQIPSLSFHATLAGTSASPQSVTIENIGNAGLAEDGLTVGANFAQVAGSGTPADCTASSELAPGGSCNISINFEPLAGGTLKSSAVLTDNSLNGNPATQSIQLSGTGTFQTTTTLTASPSTSQPFTPVTFTATVTAPSGIPSGQVTFVFNGQTVGTVTLNASGVATLKFSLPPGSDPITANYAGTTTYLPSSATMIETVL